MKQLLPLLLIFLSSILYAQPQYSDCANALRLCSKQAFLYSTVEGAGEDNMEMNNVPCIDDFGTSGNESHSLWLTFTIDNPGSLTFVLTPNQYLVDIDFVLYQMSSCDDKTVIRCMAAGSAGQACMGQTGLSFDETDISEGVGCDNEQSNFLAAVETNIGDTYMLVINCFSGSKFPFQVNFGGTCTFVGEEANTNITVTNIDNGMLIADASILPDSQQIVDQAWIFFQSFLGIASTVGAGPFTLPNTFENELFITEIISTNTGCQYVASNVLFPVANSDIPSAKTLVFPNPANQEVEFKFDANLVIKDDLYIYNHLGQLCIRKPIAVGLMDIKVGVSALPNGIYYWQIGRESGKIIVQH